MKAHRSAVFQEAMVAAQAAASAGHPRLALAHLESAHVLGQNHVVPHVRAHLAMLHLALSAGDLHDAIGQVARVVLGALGSAIGLVPHGNRGRSDEPMFARREGPDMARLFAEDRNA